MSGHSPYEIYFLLCCRIVDEGGLESNLAEIDSKIRVGATNREEKWWALHHNMNGFFESRLDDRLLCMCFMRKYSQMLDIPAYGRRSSSSSIIAHPIDGMKCIEAEWLIGRLGLPKSWSIMLLALGSCIRGNGAPLARLSLKVSMRRHQLAMRSGLQSFLRLVLFPRHAVDVRPHFGHGEHEQSTPQLEG